MKKYSLIAITAAFVAMAISAQAALIQHLSATNAASISISTNGVTSWLNIAPGTIGTNNATDIAGIGSPTWPSASLAPSGLSGVDMLPTRAGFRLFGGTAGTGAGVNAQTNWLDFTPGTGGAAGNSGFAVLVAFKANSILGGGVRDTVFCNHGNAGTANSFGIKYEGGPPRFFALGTTYTIAGNNLAAGDTVVLSFNYDKSSGAYDFWSSKGNASIGGALAANANFASVQPLYLGTSENGGQFMDGMIGEVRVYNSNLTPTELATARQEMTDLWLTPSATILPPTVSAIGGDSAVFLSWLDNNPVGAVSDFYIYRSLDSGSNYVSIATNSTTSFTDTGLANGTNYYYVLQALGTNGTLSAFSAEVSATPVAISTNAVLVQHLDATDAGSVILSGASNVVSWWDQTLNFNDAQTVGGTPGTPVYPSASLSGSSLPGVDMGTNRTGIELASVAKQKDWLDFTGNAKTNGGFSALVAFKVDAVEPAAQNTVLVNHGNPLDPNNFGLRFTASGGMQAFLGGTTYTKAGAAVEAGDTVVYAINYDDQTGAVEFWDSKNSSSLLVTNRPFGKFSSTQTLKLGTSDNVGQWFNGMIGEVKIYQGKLASAALVAEGQTLATKWGATPPPPPPSTNVVLLQHLDATIATSVITNLAGEVSSWLDQTTNANDAITVHGTNLYPSTSLSATGKAGVDLGANRNDMRLFAQTNQPAFLDYTGIYSERTGFAVLVAFKADAVQTATNNRNPVLVNHGNAEIENSFGLRFNRFGQMEAFLGGTNYLKSGAVVADGDTIVYAFNYDSVTGGFEFWDSKNNSSLNGTSIAKGNFASVQPMYIGSSENFSQYLNGMVGEVKIYTGKLDASTFEAERDALAVKWGTAVANTNADLADLVLSDGTLSPVFDSGVFSYTASVGNSVTNLTVTPTTAYYSAFVEAQVNGGGYISVDNGLSSGQPIGPLALNEGDNTVDVRVTAENPAFTQTYTITATRASGGPTPEPIITTVLGGDLILTWTDPSWELFTGTNVTALTNIVPGATSPYTNMLSEPQRYFRLVYP